MGSFDYYKERRIINNAKRETVELMLYDLARSENDKFTKTELAKYLSRRIDVLNESRMEDDDE